MNFNFNFQGQLTKDFLLSKYSEETYMEYYLGIPVKKGLFRNPLRKDEKPTCSFFRGKSGELLFRDFSGAFNGTFIDVVMTKYNCTFKEALRIIANDFGIKKSDNLIKSEGQINFHTNKFEDKGPTKIQITMKQFSEKELSWWASYGITLALLEKYNVYSCKFVFLEDQLMVTSSDTNFAFGYYGGQKDDFEYWRIYFPQRTKYRFLTNWSATMIQGYQMLPKSGKLLVITKSMKDVMVLASFGISAIAPNSENLFVLPSVLEQLKARFKYIVCLYDNDLPGISGMRKIKQKYPEIIYTWIPRKYGAKDISDYRKMFGESSTRSLIYSFIKWLKDR